MFTPLDIRPSAGLLSAVQVWCHARPARNTVSSRVIPSEKRASDQVLPNDERENFADGKGLPQQSVPMRNSEALVGTKRCATADTGKARRMHTRDSTEADHGYERV